MYCSRCGREYTGNFCPACGNREQTSSYHKLKPLLIDQNETICAVLGNNFAQTFLATGVLGRGFSILTNKRVYFKGNCLVRRGKGFYTKTEERTVDLADVTGTGYVHNNAVWAKVLKYLCLLGSTITLFSCIVDGSVSGYFPVSMLLALGFLLFFFIHKALTYSVFEISYAGGGIAFGLHWIDSQESKEFQKQLVLLKQNPKTPVQKTSSQTNSSISQQLKEFHELFTMGILSQSEFEAKKAELLGQSGVAPQNAPVTAAQASTNQAAPAQPRTSGCVTQNGWRCVCGREHAAYVSSCPCGKNKRDIL